MRIGGKGGAYSCLACSEWAFTCSAVYERSEISTNHSMVGVFTSPSFDATNKHAAPRSCSSVRGTTTSAKYKSTKATWESKTTTTVKHAQNCSLSLPCAAVPRRLTDKCNVSGKKRYSSATSASQSTRIARIRSVIWVLNESK